jgi:hypothetical protein
VFTFALALQLATLAFHQLTTHVDLFPFNNVRHYSRRERLVEAGVNGLVMAVPVALLLVDGAGTVLVSASLFSLLFAMELLMWWPPYVTGVSVPALVQGDEPWPALHARVFGPTVTVVPRISDHPRPNLEHTLLHSLTLAAAISTWAYLLGR